MTYQVIFEEHGTYQLRFDSEKEFKEWEEQGSCVSDLNYQNIVYQKIDHETRTINDN